MITPTHPKRPRKEVRLGKNPDVVYCEEDRIGQGQFGTVYRGRCPATGTVVAVKLLRDLPSAGSSEIASPRRAAAGTESDTTQDVKGLKTTNAANAAKPRPRFPSELELLWGLRGDHCPNIVHVLSVWNKPRKHHPPAPTSSATTPAAGATVPVSGSNGPGGDRPLPASSSSANVQAEARERHSNVYVLVTEYCEGGDLQHRLQALDANVPTHVARSFTYQLCNALYTLKRRRIVHRDIKPANLLLSSRAWESATLKVADFGMAKAAPPPKVNRRDVARRASGGVGERGAEAGEGGSGDGPGAEALLQDGDEDESNVLPSTLFYSEMGTPMYMSPERIAGQPYDYKADVYSAGMVLLEMMRGACVRVTRVSQLRTMVPETLQRLSSRYTAKGEAIPAWLDLVHKMTATDPGQRISVEDALRHRWFAEAAGPPLPPLTFGLPSPTPAATPAETAREAGEAELKADDKPGEKNELTAEAATPQVRASTETTTPTGRRGGEEDLGKKLPAAPSEANNQAAGRGSADATGGAQPPVIDPLVPPSCAEGTANRDGDTPAPPSGGRHRRQEPPSHWSLLGVCAQLNTQYNTARCVSTGPTPKLRHGATFTTFLSAPAANAGTAGSAAGTVGPAAGLTLPAGCGPHIITHAVRGFVDVVYLYVLQDELDPVGGLTLVSFLVELVQNGFAAYLECLESLSGLTGTTPATSAGSHTTTTACTATPAATTSTMAAESASDAPSGVSPVNNGSISGAMLGSTGACINGHRFAVKDVNGLPEVWQTLMVRLSHAQAVYKAQLPPRMLQNAALWRRRVLRATTTGAAGTAADREEEGEGEEEGAEDSRLYAASTTSSEGEAAMPGLPNVASITNVSAAAGRGAGRAAAAAAASSSTSTSTATHPHPAGAGPVVAPLRVYTRTTRAEQLIFAKAVDCIQSEALAVLMTAPTVCAATQRETTNAAGAAHTEVEPLDAVDCLEEEEDAVRGRRSVHATAAPSTSAQPTRRSSFRASTATSTAPAPPSSAMPPHRGIALLRVLLQRAVLSAAEVGLESEAAARSPPLGPAMASPVVDAHGDPVNRSFTPPARHLAAASTGAEADDYTFVVQVPVYATLQSADVQVVENLLCAATRVFTSTHRPS